MRISNEQAQQILAAQKLKGAKGVMGASEVGRTTGLDAMSVSATGLEIGKALQSLNSVPDIRADRVAELKARIESGQYHVSGNDVAESLLRRAADQLL